MLSELSTTVDILNGLKNLVSRSESQKDNERQFKELLFRNYYSEIFYNKKIFETINLNSGLNKDFLASLKEIAPLLKNEYGKSIVASLGKFSDDIENMEIQADLEDRNDKTERSLIHRIIFTVNRIEVLQQLSRMTDSRYLKKINVTARLKNIKNDTNRLCHAFNESFEDVINNIII